MTTASTTSTWAPGSTRHGSGYVGSRSAYACGKEEATGVRKFRASTIGNMKLLTTNSLDESGMVTDVVFRIEGCRQGDIRAHMRILGPESQVLNAQFANQSRVSNFRCS